MKHSILLASLAVAALLAATSCAPAPEPTYSVEGTTPQECYSVILTTDSVDVPFQSYKGKTVSGFTMPSKSRPFIAHDLLAATLSPVRIACGDTLFRFRNASEVYTYTVKYDRKCVPDYGVLLSDFMARGGLVADTAVEPALELYVADTEAFRRSVAPFLRSTGVNIRFDADGNWMYYTPMPEGDTRCPMHLFEVVSALRYWWNMPVVPDPTVDRLELLTTGTDFATPGLDSAQVAELLMHKFGMALRPAGRDVTVVTVKVQQ